MEVGEPAEDVPRVAADGGLVEPAAVLLDRVGEGSPRRVLHEEVESSVESGRRSGDVEAQVGDDEGRVERGEDSLLALQRGGAADVSGLDGEELAG